MASHGRRGMSALLLGSETTEGPDAFQGAGDRRAIARTAASADRLTEFVALGGTDAMTNLARIDLWDRSAPRPRIGGGFRGCGRSGRRAAAASRRSTPRAAGALLHWCSLRARNSPVYRDFYRSLPERELRPNELPIATKRALMARFDDWVTDREVTLQASKRSWPIASISASATSTATLCGRVREDGHPRHLRAGCRSPGDIRRADGRASRAAALRHATPVGDAGGRRASRAGGRNRRALREHCLLAARLSGARGSRRADSRSWIRCHSWSRT